MKYLIILLQVYEGRYLGICYNVILYSMINTLAYEISQVHIEREVHRDSPIKSLYNAGICGMCNYKQFWEYTDSITAFDPSFRKIA